MLRIDGGDVAMEVTAKGNDVPDTEELEPKRARGGEMLRIDGGDVAMEVRGKVYEQALCDFDNVKRNTLLLPCITFTSPKFGRQTSSKMCIIYNLITILSILLFVGVFSKVQDSIRRTYNEQILYHYADYKIRRMDEAKGQQDTQKPENLFVEIMVDFVNGLREKADDVSKNNKKALLEGGNEADRSINDEDSDADYAGDNEPTFDESSKCLLNSALQPS